MIHERDKEFLIRRCCTTIDCLSHTRTNNKKLIKLNIVERVKLLELQKHLEEILEKCKDDGY